jgi:transposase
VRHARKQSQIKGLELRVMFQDEARFGRISDPKRCWTPPGVRPHVGIQLVREFTYAYGAVSPSDGVSDFLILPSMTAEVMNLFLAEVARRHPKEYIFMLYDGAPCHSPTALAIPENMMVKTLPPYCPELNPTEHLWDEIREKFFPNLVFQSLAAVENQLVEAVLYLENNPSIVQSITGFPWILKVLAKN